jgi:macrolide-specific efflux system membrane fusion protein
MRDDLQPGGTEEDDMKRRQYIIMAAVLLATAGLYFGFVHRPGTGVPAAAAYLVQRADLEEVVSSLGKLEPATYVDVGAQVSGQLIALHVELGDTVKKGDLLVEIDPRSHKAQVDADRATLANLEAILAERKANFVQAQRNYTREAALRKNNAASELAAQTSETAYKVAQAQVQAVEAQIQQARANLESHELDLSYTNIYAPIAGTIVTLEVKEGQTLNDKQSTPQLMRIAELELMTVWASVSEADVNKLRAGMDVYFTTIGNTSTRHYATVQNILPSYTKENDVILYNVTFDVKNPDKIFFPAMNTQVFFVLSQAKGALSLPVQVLPASSRDAKKAVLTVVSGKREEKREVSFGVRTRTSVEVLDGLEEGEMVRAAVEPPRANAGTMRPMTPRF